MNQNRIAVLSVALLAFAPQALSQSSEGFLRITAGMGIGAHSAPSIADYVNLVAQPGSSQRFDEFTAAVEFFVAPEFQILEDWSIGMEYSVMVKSHAVSQSGSVGGSEFSYTIQLPSLVAHHIVGGEGYRLKFGGGIGYAGGEFSQRLFGSTGSTDFRSSGLTAKLEAVGNTKFDESFYGSIGADIRWVTGGVFKGARGIEAAVAGTKASMTFFNLGLKMGVTFVF